MLFAGTNPITKLTEPSPTNSRLLCDGSFTLQYNSIIRVPIIMVDYEARKVTKVGDDFHTTQAQSITLSPRQTWPKYIIYVRETADQC